MFTQLTMSILLSLGAAASPLTDSLTDSLTNPAPIEQKDIRDYDCRNDDHPHCWRLVTTNYGEVGEVTVVEGRRNSTETTGMYKIQIIGGDTDRCYASTWMSVRKFKWRSDVNFYSC